MDGTILGQGSFTATYPSNPNAGNAVTSAGSPYIVQIPSNADWMEVYSYTQFGTAGNNNIYINGSAAATNFSAVTWYWQRGMAAGTGIVKYKSNGAQGLNGDTLTAGGFTLYDPSGQSAGSQPMIGNPVATTASTNATRPVVSTASTTGVAIGTIVRMSGTAQTDVNGVDMVVGAVTLNTNFTLLTATNALATAPGAVGGVGFYSIVNYGPLFYPTRLYVTNITQAVNAQVSTSIPHNYVAGQAVRFNIPTISGMVQLNPTPQNNYAYAWVLTVVDAYNFTININTSAFTAFTWPTIAQMPGSFPIVAPVGEDSATSLSSTQPQQPPIPPLYYANNGLLSDSVVNTGYLGMILGSGGLATITGAGADGIAGPAGQVTYTAGNVATGDVMYWKIGKSTFGGL
jgi:hypothetical protein